MGSQIRAGFPLRQRIDRLIRGKSTIRVADELDQTLNFSGIDFDADDVAIQHFANGSAPKTLRSDVTNACSGGDARETRIGQKGDVFAERDMLEGTGDLIRF